VFEAMLERAMRLSGAIHGSLTEYDGELFRCVANHNLPEALFELLSQPRRAAPNSPQERLLQGEHIIHITDMAEIWASSDNQVARAAAEIGFTRTVLFVPLRKDNALLGYITAARREVRPFSDKQMELLENFAAQAVIAMENARLITETREALEQQTATTEVLLVINSSPGDLAPVFDAMLERAMHLCGASFGMLHTYEADQFHGVASRGVPPAFAEYLANNPLKPRPGTIGARFLSGEPLVHITDVADDELYRSDDPQRRALVELGGARTTMLVALTKDRSLLGTIQLYRQHVRPFSEKQIALLQNFAAQAVIAIENARLLTETREALKQQTATAEVLQVINSSPGDLAPVFEAILEKAHDLCGAAHGNLWTYDGELFHPVATRGNPRFAEWLRDRSSVPPGPGTVLERIVRGEDFLQIADAASDQAFCTSAYSREVIEVTGARTTLIISLRKDTTLLGVIFCVPSGSPSIL
jgi:GAF domain-containing protein